VFRSVYEPAISAPRRFNAGKKLLAVMVGVALALLLVSGVPMYAWWWFGGELVQRARDLHVLASFGLTALIAGHIYLAAFGPSGLLKSGSGHKANPVLEDAAQ
jgi:cytochrome b subunit of formate dehydrogenase